MRTIDMHAHLPGHAMGLSPRSTADVLAMMDMAGIDQQVVMTIDGLFHDPVAGNDALAAQTAEAGGRLIPFCTVDPYDEGAVAEVRRCVEDLGFRGVKLHPWWQGFSPLNPLMRPSALVPVEEIPKLGSGKSDFNRAKALAREAQG